MWVFFKKFVSAFSYGSGFMLAVVCAVYVLNQYSSSSVQLASSAGSASQTNNNYLKNIEFRNISE